MTAWLLGPLLLLLVLSLPIPSAHAGDSLPTLASPQAGVAVERLTPEAAVAAASSPYLCDGQPLIASLHPGAVDDPGIPNSSAGTVPGAFVQLQWRQGESDLSLQLPRTNNAGAPSFTDGKWWWSLEDPGHPRFRLRSGRGDIQDFACEPA